jgi:DNA-binding transcriptional ArsR family regulator
VPLDPNAEEPERDPLQDFADGLLGFGHPIRIRILVLLEFEYSPKLLTDALGDMPLGVVSYHTRMLRDYGLAELARTEPARGALQHFYHRTALGDDLMSRLAMFFDVPNYKPGQVGTEKRHEQLKKWAYRKPATPAEPEPEANAEAA